MDSVDQIKEHSIECLQNSQFFQQLRSGDVPRHVLDQIFGQYYFWRNALHKWFGLCIEKSPIFGLNKDEATSTVLRTLCDHIVEDTNHLNLYKNFLKTIGVDINTLTIATPTTAYIESFWTRFGDADFSVACAALAGRELLSSIRSEIIREALRSQYGVEDVRFWNAHIEDEEIHFWHMWTPLTELGADQSTLLAGAKEEIRRHVGFWDDLRNQYVAEAA